MKFEELKLDEAELGLDPNNFEVIGLKLNGVFLPIAEVRGNNWQIEIAVKNSAKFVESKKDD